MESKFFYVYILESLAEPNRYYCSVKPQSKGRVAWASCPRVPPASPGCLGRMPKPPWHSSLTEHYTGFTEDLYDRLRHHNDGAVPHTSTHRRWRLRTALAFSNRERALDFERYLKTGSGRAFARKRL